MREQRSGPGDQGRIGGGDAALQHGQRLCDDAPIGIAELAFQTIARARGAKRLRRDAAPPPVGIVRHGSRGGHAGGAIGLRHRDERLASQREDAAAQPVPQGGERGPAAQHTERRLRLYRHANVAIGDERHDGAGEARIAERGERAQRVDADVGIGVAEQPPQRCHRIAPVEPCAVQQRLADASRRDGARLRVRIAERARERRGARGRAQPGERVEGAPAGRRIGRVGEPDELGERRARAQAPRFEQCGIHHRRRGTRRARGNDIAERAGAVVTTDFGNGGHRLELGRALVARPHRADRLEQRRDGARILEQAERKRRRRLDGGHGVLEHGNQQIHRRAVADPAGGQSGLAPHARIRMAQRLAQRRAIEPAGV